jgi:hypothetical protein
VRENGTVVQVGKNALKIAVEPSEMTSDDATVVVAE